MTQQQMIVELDKLPPALRERYKTPEGEREITQSVVDKRLLVQEARRRSLDKDEAIQRQVRELEERLIVQKLLAEEEKSGGALSEADARSWYEQNKSSLLQAERVHAARLFVKLPAHATAKERSQANTRLSELLRRVQRNAPFEKVAAECDGPEALQGGDLGLVARGDWHDEAFEEAVFALKGPGELTPIVQGRSGLAVFKLIEKRPARIPSFEEARSEIEGRMAPAQKRKVFDQMVLKLRQAAEIQFVSATSH